MTADAQTATAGDGLARILVVGADRGFTPPAGSTAHWSALCVDEVKPERAGAEVVQAIGVRTKYPDQTFDLVVLTSRLSGLWSQWSELLLAEARRVGTRVVATTALREQLTEALSPPGPASR